MRIAHVTISHDARDIRVFHKECRSLAAAGHVVHLFVPGPAPAEADGVHFHSLPDVGATTAYFWRVWPKLPQMYRATRRVAADVYHMPDPALIPLGIALKLRGARLVYDAHEDRPKQARPARSPRLRLQFCETTLVPPIQERTIDPSTGP